MASNDYHFVSHWQVEGSCKEVFEVIDNPLDLTRWWPSVYLEARELEPGDEEGTGRVVELLTKGWLPYRLKWKFRALRKVRFHLIEIEAMGDFNGRGTWNFAQDGPWVKIQFDWRIRADKPILKYLSFLLKPVFSANHRWAMKQGEKALVAELDRRRKLEMIKSS